MEIYINSNVELVNNNVCYLLMNFENQTVIGLDEKGVNFWRKTIKNELDKVDIENNKDLFQALIELEMIICKEDRYRKFNTAYVHLLNRCNLNCLGCYSMDENRNKQSDASLDDWKKAFDRLVAGGVENIVVSGGEPLLRKDIVEILKYAKETGITNINLITNGTVKFDFKRLVDYVDSIAVSVDGYAAENPTFIRNEGIFDKIMATIDEIRKVGIDVAIIPTIHQKNYTFMKEYDQLAAKKGTEISFSILSVPQNEVFEDYRLNNCSLKRIANDLIDLNVHCDEGMIAGEGLCANKSCGLAQGMLSISANGNIYPCHLLQCDEFLMGNIFKHDLKEENLNMDVLKKCKTAVVDKIEDCKDCEHKYLCGGGCRGRAYFRTGSILGKDEYCTLYKTFHEREIKILMEEVERCKLTM